MAKPPYMAEKSLPRFDRQFPDELVSQDKLAPILSFQQG